MILVSWILIGVFACGKEEVEVLLGLYIPEFPQDI
jgi:hypothetical protein